MDCDIPCLSLVQKTAGRAGRAKSLRSPRAAANSLSLQGTARLRKASSSSAQPLSESSRSLENRTLESQWLVRPWSDAEAVEGASARSHRVVSCVCRSCMYLRRQMSISFAFLTVMIVTRQMGSVELEKKL